KPIDLLIRKNIEIMKISEENEAQIMKIKEVEIIKKIKNMIEGECLERMVLEIMRKEEEVLNIEKIKESNEKNTSTMAAVSRVSVIFDVQRNARSQAINEVVFVNLRCGGIEYFYGARIQQCPARTTQYETPLQVIDLGVTHVPKDVFQIIQFHKEVEKIASSFYITNFSDYVDAKRLWVECQSYGRIVGAFIANKRSKAGKRFGFVRFLCVKNEEQLARSLASILIGSYHIFAFVARFNRQEKNEAFSKNNGDKMTNSIPSQKADHVGPSQKKKSYASSLNGDRDSKVQKQVTAVKGNTLSNVPLTSSLITPALVLDDSCVSVRDLSRHVMGRVKDLNSILNLRTLLTNKGFSDVKLTYLGGMWVMIELDNEATKLKLLQHIGVNSWFHVLQTAIHDFVSDERVVWVDIEGVPLNVWSRSQHGEDDLVDDSDVEGVSDTFFGDIHPSPNNSVCNSSEKVVEQQSEDPFCIYDVLNKKPKGVAQDSDSSLSHPPGFTPEVSRQENDHRGVNLNTETDRVNSPLVHTKVMNNSQKVHENVTSNGESAFSYSHNAHNGGSILEVLDDMIRVGQSMGYAMEWCMKDIEHIIGTQGVDAIPK
nr:RNA-directed DNA polymerase, eukaryota, nucleotide-binding alpha-beta plait domain protein [Tanacetum cinerariifolium]